MDQEHEDKQRITNMEAKVSNMENLWFAQQVPTSIHALEASLALVGDNWIMPEPERAIDIICKDSLILSRWKAIQGIYKTMKQNSVLLLVGCVLVQVFAQNNMEYDRKS